jgi:hypothetical protein
MVICTADDGADGSEHDPGSELTVRDRSVVVLRRERAAADGAGADGRG